MKEAIKLVAPEWSDNCKEYEMKKSLRKGTYADLNVYFFPVIGCVGALTIPPHEMVFG